MATYSIRTLEGQVILGLENLPRDHAQLLMLVPDRPLETLQVGEATTATARRDVYQVRRDG